MNTPPCLLLALEIDGSDRGNMRVTFVGLGTSRVEWRADLVAGSRFRVASGGVGLWGLRAWGRIGSPILPNFSDRLDVPGVRFRHRGVGDPIVPRSGGRVGASYADVISRGPQAEVPLSWFQRVSQDGSLFSGVSGGGRPLARKCGASGRSRWGARCMPPTSYWGINLGLVRRVTRRSCGRGDARADVHWPRVPGWRVRGSGPRAGVRRRGAFF